MFYVDMFTDRNILETSHQVGVVGRDSSMSLRSQEQLELRSSTFFHV